MKYAPNPFFVGAVLVVAIICNLLDYNSVTPGGASWLTKGPYLAVAVLGAWLLLSAFWKKPNGGSSSGTAGGGGTPSTASRSTPLLMLAVPATFLGLAGLPYPPHVEQHVAAIAAIALVVVLLVVVYAIFATGRRAEATFREPLA